MGRRFLTAEDVRRLGGPTITVDADTVVTPQALEAAASMGVQIDSGSGSYAPPVPDRGPDAQRAQETIGHLPEPGSAGAMRGDAAGKDRDVIVTVVGRNRPGVLAEITAHLAGAGCNIAEVSQEIVDVDIAAVDRPVDARRKVDSLHVFDNPIDLFRRLGARLVLPGRPNDVRRIGHPFSTLVIAGLGVCQIHIVQTGNFLGFRKIAWKVGILTRVCRKRFSGQCLIR